MADQVKLVAEPRPGRGTRPAKRLRAEGRTPGVVYGVGVDATPIAVDTRELGHVLHTEAGFNVLIRLQLDGDEHLAMPREIQRHPVRDDILHVDLLAVSRDQLLDIEVPIHLLGDDVVSRDTGGVVQLVLHALPIQVRPLDVPNALELDIEGMVIGDVRRAADVPLPDGAELNIDPERTIVTVNPPDILEEPEEAVAGLAGLSEEELAGLSEEERAALVEQAEEAAEEGEAPEGEGGESSDAE